jgi:type II secretory pathway pseudopilin PulG
MVIVIIGILVVSLVPKLLGAQSRARDTIRITDMAGMFNALRLHKIDHDIYPSGT